MCADWCKALALIAAYVLAAAAIIPYSSTLPISDCIACVF
jgi:hypothetical protein